MGRENRYMNNKRVAKKGNRQEVKVSKSYKCTKQRKVGLGYEFLQEQKKQREGNG